MFEIINTKKYLCWTLEHFIEEMKVFHADRSIELMAKIKEQGISPQEGMRQMKAKQGEAYDIFLRFSKVGGDDFFQEIFTCLSFIDFLGHNDVESVAFPVKDTCPENISLVELKKYIENDTEYDFLIKKEGVFIKFQLKSAPEQHIKEFSSAYFIKDIISQTTKYNDPEMILVYLLQPAIERTSPEEFYGMIDEVCAGIGDNLPVRNIFFTGRIDLETFEYTQVYQEVVRRQIDTNKTLYNEIKNHEAF